MDRNFVLAFLLSAVVIFGYYSFFPPAQPKPKVKVEQAQDASADTPGGLEKLAKEAHQEAAAEPGQTAAKPLLDAQALAQAEAGRAEIRVTTPKYVAVIDTKEGVLTSMTLTDYQYAGPIHMRVRDWIMSTFTDEDPTPIAYDPQRRVNMVGDSAEGHMPWRFRLDSKGEAPVYFRADKSELNLTDQPGTLTLTGVNAEGLTLIKTITFDPKTYSFEVVIETQNPTANDKIVQPDFLLGAGPELVVPDRNMYPKNGVEFVEGDIETYDFGDLEDGEIPVKDAEWVASMSMHFVQGLVKVGADGKAIPLEAKMLPVKSSFRDEESLVAALLVQEKSQKLAAGASLTHDYRMYFGPKLYHDLENFHESFVNSLDLWLSFIAYPLLAALRWFQSHVVNWGVAIILLTLSVRTLMLPLAYKGMRSMKKMGHLGPRIKHLREKYKNDKEKLNIEIMNLYKKNNVNPVGGCLPLLMQVPIFIALYQALMPAVELRHQSFALWMDNLSAPDHTLILPILMGLTMLIQQKITPQPNMEPIQQKMMMWMPVLMVFFFLEMPSGLVLYWVASNIFTIFQQQIFNRVREQEIKH